MPFKKKNMGYLTQVNLSANWAQVGNLRFEWVRVDMVGFHLGPVQDWDWDYLQIQVCLG